MLLAYKVPAYRAAGHIRLTNKTPCGTIRRPAVTNPPLFARGSGLPSPPKSASTGRDPPPQFNRKGRDAYYAGPRNARTHIVYDPATTPTAGKTLGRADCANCQPNYAHAAPRRKSRRRHRDVRREERTWTVDTVRVEVKPMARRSRHRRRLNRPGRRNRHRRKSAPTHSASTTPASTSSTARPTVSTRAWAHFASRVTVMCGEAHAACRDQNCATRR